MSEKFSNELKEVLELGLSKPDVFVDILKLALYKTGNKMVDESWLTEFEKRIVDWLVNNQELKLKDFFLADLSWVQHLNTTRPQTIADFFTKRMGKRVFELLPDDIKNYVLANSIK